jgi:hypothetical protein
MKLNDDLLLKEIILDNDVRSYAGISSQSLSETQYVSNMMPGSSCDGSGGDFSPKLTSYELLNVKKAVNINRVIDYYLWAYDEKLTEAEKIKGKRNCKTLLTVGI